MVDFLKKFSTFILSIAVIISSAIVVYSIRNNRRHDFTQGEVWGI